MGGRLFGPRGAGGGDGGDPLLPFPARGLRPDRQTPHGKTSIFLEVRRRLREVEGVVPVYLSLWELVESTPEEFARGMMKSSLEAF